MSTRDFLNNRPDIRQTNSAEYEQAMQKYTPVNQQRVESHVVPPLLIAFIVSLVLTLMTLAAMVTYWRVDAFILSMVFGGSFLFVFGRRIGVADKVLWAIEDMFNLDLNDDNQIGYAPRNVPLTRRTGTTNLPLPEQAEGLTRSEWQQVAIAILNKQGGVSRRGIYKNSDLSQSKSTAAARHLENGYAKDGKLNGEGWDWLSSHLPDGINSMIDRPTDNPPTPLNSG